MGQKLKGRGLEEERYPVRGTEDTDAAGIGDGGDELGARYVGAEGALDDAIIEPKNPSPTHLERRLGNSGRERGGEQK